MKKKTTGLTLGVLLFILCFVLLAPSSSAPAQQPKKVPRLGYPLGGTRSSVGIYEEAFRHGLRDLGYVDGINISIESRYAEGKLTEMPAIVNELVQQKVYIIFAGTNASIVAAKQRTTTIPIVMVSSVNPVVAGYVDSLAHPGGNVTGLATMSRELSAKRIELIKELIPNLSRIAMLWDVEGPGPIVASKDYQEAAQRFKLKIQSLELHSHTPDIEGLFRAARRERAEALIIVSNPLTSQHAHRIIELANRNQLPTMSEDIRFVDAGGLLFYATDARQVYRRAATYKVLKGAKPADIPVEQPTKFELVINLKTAKQIGLTISPNVLARADRVIK